MGATGSRNPYDFVGHPIQVFGCQSKRTTLRLEEYAALTDERARLEFLANLCADIHLVCWGQQVWCPRPPDRSGQCVHLLKQVNSQFMTLVKY